MKIIIIAALAENRGIGKDNNLLWHLPADMKFFKEQTTGHVIITGRKNYESIPEKFRPLPDRINIVVTRDKNYVAPGAIIVHTIEEGIKMAQDKNAEKCFIIGGGQIYKEVLEKNMAHEMIITRVDANLEADTFFPEIHEDKWEKTFINTINSDEKNKFGMKFYHYQFKKSIN